MRVQVTLGVACFPSVFRSIKAAGKVIVSTEIGGMPIAEIGISATESWNILANGFNHPSMKYMLLNS